LNDTATAATTTAVDTTRTATSNNQYLGWS
jgi:hypothetical protein